MNSTSFNRLLNEKYFLLKDIAKKYHYSEELLDMMTYTYISLYMTLGKSCDFPLYDLYNKVKIIYDSGTVNDIALKNNLGQVPRESVAVTIFKPNLNVFKNASLKQKPQTIVLGTHVGDLLATPILKLEMLLHEVRHALMGYYNTNFLSDPNTYYMRSGLKETFYTRTTDLEEKFLIKKFGMTLDEIINTYITELLINKILSFKKYEIENSHLRCYLNTLKTDQPDKRYRSIGYHSEVRLLYPLLLNEMFISITDQHQFDGEIDIIKEFINYNNDICSYQDFIQLLDRIYNDNNRYKLEAENNNMDFVQTHMNNINKVKSIVLNINQKTIR